MTPLKTDRENNTTIKIIYISGRQFSVNENWKQAVPECWQLFKEIFLKAKYRQFHHRLKDSLGYVVSPSLILIQGSMLEIKIRSDYQRIQSYFVFPHMNL